MRNRSLSCAGWQVNWAVGGYPEGVNWALLARPRRAPWRIASSGYDNRMDAAQTPRATAPAEPDESAGSDSPAPAIVYLVVGVGLAICILAMLVARPSFDTTTIGLALLMTVPFLLFARLAIARPGPDAVVAGVLLLAVGCWGSVSAIGDGAASSFVRIALSLIVVQLAVFVAGAVLRATVPRSSPPD